MAQRRNFWKTSASGVINPATNALIPSATGTAWTLSTGGSQVTDMQYIDASGISTGAVPSGILTADSSGFVPSFKGPPNDVGVLWLDFGHGRFAVIAYDPVMYAKPVTGHSHIVIPDVPISPTQYDVYNSAGSLEATFKMSDYTAGNCAPAASQYAINACGSGAAPTPTGGAYVDRRTVGFGDGDYPMVEAAGQVYCVVVAGTNGYWCRGIGPLSWSPSVIDRALPSDELMAGVGWRYIGGNGTVGTGSTTDPQATTTKRMLQVGTLASGSRKADNPHGFMLGPIGFMSTNTMTQFDFVVMNDTNDFEVWGTQFAGNYGTGNGCIRMHGTLQPDDGPMAWRIHKVFARDIYRAVIIGTDTVGASDGEINNCRFLANRDYSMKLAAGGIQIQGGHYTCATNLSPGHLMSNSGGPCAIYGGYWDTNNSTGSPIKISSATWLVNGAVFRLSGLYAIDASGGTGWKSTFTNLMVWTGGAQPVGVILYPNSVATNVFTANGTNNAGAVTLGVTATPVAVAVGDVIRFANGVHARITTAAGSGATSLAVAGGLPGAIPTTTQGTVTPVQYSDITVDAMTGGQSTAFKGMGVTVGGTVLDFLQSQGHAVDPAHLRRNS